MLTVCDVPLPASASGSLSFPDLLRKLHADGHTGAVVLHFAGGEPRKAELLAPSTRIALDTSK